MVLLWTPFPDSAESGRGARVGPLLLSLFTRWFLAELKERTSAEWVSCLVTWFADDSHLGWHIHTQRDLDFVCRFLRATFALLRECGMCANTLKSTMVLGIRGSYATRWIKAHTVISNGRRPARQLTGDSRCQSMYLPGHHHFIPGARAANL